MNIKNAVQNLAISLDRTDTALILFMTAALFPSILVNLY